MPQFKTPKFWYPENTDKTCWIAACLKPLSWLYLAAHKLNQALYATPYHADSFVICVGNLVAGGSGKTPTAIALQQLLQTHYNNSKSSCFLTRGYGGALTGPCIVNNTHTVSQCGDESLLLQAYAPVIISEDRVLGIKYAMEKGRDIVIMDDGFQNLSVHKNLSFIVIDGKSGFGNGALLPAGPLREHIKDGTDRAHGFIIIHNDKGRISQKLLEQLPKDKPVFTAHLETNQKPEKNKNYIAFSGLGQPSKFFGTLKQNNYNVIDTIEYPDHYIYTHKDITALYKKAKDQKARLITTEKDLVRIPEELRADIEILKVELIFDEAKKLTDFITSKIPD